MRQGQQNRRGRGRNNNNNTNSNGSHHNNGARKGQNPLARSFESSGPDVKLRGTPAHIAEKYMALARDAQSSGDPVLAENYLQHAEHYNRIILAYRDQQIAQGSADPGTAGVARTRAQFGDSTDTGDIGDEDGDDQGGMMPGNMSQPQVGFGDQPPMPAPQRFEGGGGQRFEGRPQRDNRQDHQPRGDVPRYPPRDRQQSDRQQGDRQQGEPRGGFQDRGERPMRPDRPDRPDRMDRPQRSDRPDRPERVDRPERLERPERVDRPEPIERVERLERPERAERPVPVQPEGFAGDAPPRRRERFQPPAGLQNDQPEFLRRPVRRPRRDESSEAAPDPAPAPAAVIDDQE